MVRAGTAWLGQVRSGAARYGCQVRSDLASGLVTVRNGRAWRGKALYGMAKQGPDSWLTYSLAQRRAPGSDAETSRAGSLSITLGEDRQVWFRHVRARACAGRRNTRRDLTWDATIRCGRPATLAWSAQILGVRYGRALLGTASRGQAWRGVPGKQQVRARVGPGEFWTANKGALRFMAWLGTAWQVQVRQGREMPSRWGVALGVRRGKPGLGQAWHRLAWRGEAWLMLAGAVSRQGLRTNESKHRR